MIGNIFKFIINKKPILNRPPVVVISLFLIIVILFTSNPINIAQAETSLATDTANLVKTAASYVAPGSTWLAESAVSVGSAAFASEGKNPYCNANPSTWPNCFLAYISQTVLEMAAVVLMGSAMLFNALIDMTLNIKDFVTKVPIVNLGWTTFRDFTNIFFIFIILFIAISTIMGNEGYGIKKLLGKTIITAILINFSLFFTQIIIDTSNIVALQFYAKITENIPKGEPTSSVNATETNDGGISAAFVKAVGLQKIYTSNGSTQSAVATAETNYLESTSNGNPWYNIIIVGIGGTVFILITSFILIAGAFMLLIRTLTLIFLMILSPLAFMGGILPSTQGYVKQWWDVLIKNALFAPAYMALLYLVASMVLKNTGSSLNPNNANFVDMLTGNNQADWIGVLTTYIILNALMIGCIVLASKIGAGGSSMAMKWGKNIGNTTLGFVGRGVGGATFGAGAWVGRKAIGGSADYLAERMRSSNFASTAVGRRTMGALKGIAGGSFDARNVAGVGKTLGIGSGSTGGYRGALDATVKAKTEYGESLRGDAKKAFAQRQGSNTLYSRIVRGRAGRIAGANVMVKSIEDDIKDKYTDRISDVSGLISTYENDPEFKAFEKSETTLEKLKEKRDEQTDKLSSMIAVANTLARAGDPGAAAALAAVDGQRTIVNGLNTKVAVAQTDFTAKEAALTTGANSSITYKDHLDSPQTTNRREIAEKLKEVRSKLTEARKLKEAEKAGPKKISRNSGLNI